MKKCFKIDVNSFPIDKRVQIIQLLIEGNSMRSVNRIVGYSINTVTELLHDVGRSCRFYPFALSLSKGL